MLINSPDDREPICFAAPRTQEVVHDSIRQKHQHRHDSCRHCGHSGSGLFLGGPGFELLLQQPAAAALFDEDEVIAIYESVNPAVVEISTGESGGSGFLIDSDGYIVTNDHVVEDEETVTVNFSDGSSSEADVTGRLPGNDLALLKVESSDVEGVTPVTLGDSSGLKPGQLAIAIGAPFGLEGTITVGVVSQVNRDMPSHVGRLVSGVIQTDAIINPGNSGGPLLDSNGEVIGVTTAIRTGGLGATFGGVGFAVPINFLKDNLDDLKEGGVIRPPWLGIRATGLTPKLVEDLDLSVESGVYVIEVESDSPAEDAGLVGSGFEGGSPASGGDIITAVNGISVDSVMALITQLDTYSPGDDAPLTIVRDGEAQTVTVTLGEWPEDRHDPTTPDRFPPDFAPGIPDGVFPDCDELDLPPQIEEWFCDRFPSD